MPDFLLELFSEEIPARMQRRAEDDFNRLMSEALASGGLTFSEVNTFSGPRRLALIVNGLAKQSQATVEERKGPRVGAPEKAVAGFLRSAGLASLDECQTANDGKGEYYVARIERPGRPSTEIVAEAVTATVNKFPWPKSMRWGGGHLRWVRPLQAILCVLDLSLIHI
jgi:glycyl-tRNA synthetase beta chain